jgi:hypothetical protein
VVNGGIKEGDMKGLWGIRFGNGQGGADVNTLFFAAGIHAEADGLFGKVTAVTSPNVHHHGELNAAVLSTADPRPTPGSGPSLNRSQDSPPAKVNISFSTPAQSETTSDQTEASVSKVDPVARRVNESAIDQVFSELGTSLDS